MYYGISYTCSGCQSPFQNSCALSIHQAKSLYCNNYIVPLQRPTNTPSFKNTSTEQDQVASINLPKNNNEYEIDEQRTNPIPIEHNDTSSVYSGDSVSNTTFHFSTDIINEVKLLKILTNIGAPLYAYKILMQWMHEAHMSNYEFDTKNKTYHQTISYLENDLNSHIARSKYVPVTLLPDQLKLNVVVFDVKKILASFFADTSLNQVQNLVINKNTFC